MVREGFAVNYSKFKFFIKTALVAAALQLPFSPNAPLFACVRLAAQAGLYFIGVLFKY